LSSGVADGTFFPLESIVSFKLSSVIKYATLFPGGFYSSAFGFFMNEDAWNKLPKEDQAAIESVSGEPLARLAGKAWDAADAVALEEMKRVGIAISEASPALVNGVQERAKAIEDKWVKDATAKGIDGAKVLAAFREEVKRGAAGN
jgi:TRAP-type C4-dicarboxylate transport system substrate-binding protein